jgi:hypothetical protein
VNQGEVEAGGAEKGKTAQLLVIAAVGVAAIGAAIAVTTYRNRTPRPNAALPAAAASPLLPPRAELQSR